MKKFLFEDVALNFIEKNETKKNSILFLHGNSHSLRTYGQQMESELFSEYRLVFVDLPGHGDSSPSKTYSLKRFAQIIKAFMTELSLENAVIVGHSVGGHVALNTLKVGINPAGLFIFGTPPLKNPFDPSSFFPNPKGAPLAKLEVVNEEIIMLMDELNYREPYKTIALEDFLKTDARFRQEIFADIINQVHEDETKLLQAFDGHTIFLLASDETLINNNYIKQELFPRISKVLLLDIKAGHSSHIENSGDFNLALSEFCKSVFNKNEVNYIETSDHTNESNENEQRNQ